MCLHIHFLLNVHLPKGLFINLENAPVRKNHYHLFKQYVHIRENAPYFMLFIHEYVW